MDHPLPISQLAQTRPELEQQQAAAAQAGREFDSPEEMLRFDAAQTRPPPAVEQRLKHSISQEALPKRSWWRRWLFGGR